MSGIIGGAGSKTGIIGSQKTDGYTVCPSQLSGHAGTGGSRTFNKISEWASEFHIVFYPSTNGAFSGSLPGSVSSAGSDHILVRFNGQGGSSNNHLGYNHSSSLSATAQQQGIECNVGSGGRHLFGAINIIKFSPTQYFYNTSGLLTHNNIANYGGGVFYLATYLEMIQLTWTAGSSFDSGVNYVVYK